MVMKKDGDIVHLGRDFHFGRDTHSVSIGRYNQEYLIVGIYLPSGTRSFPI